MKFTPEQLKEADKIIKFHKSKDKELKKVARVLFSDFLDKLKLGELFVKFRYVWYNEYDKCPNYTNYEIKSIKKINPTICMYLLTSDEKYLARNCKKNQNVLRVCGSLEYLLNEFYTKVTIEDQ